MNWDASSVITEASKMELFIEIFVNNRYSGQWTSDLRKDALKTFINNAVTTTKLLAKDLYRTLPAPKYYQGRPNIDLEVMDPDYPNLTAEGRHKIVKTIENACLKKGGEKVI